jgi:hypothetical protein
MSAQDVSSITGAPLDYIQRFEGPVVAEREFVVTSALAVPVRSTAESDPLAPPRNFGTVIRERLHELGGIGERWASWKDDSGWVVKLSFTAGQVDHDARWQFDPKKQALSPLNSEAITLSQQGDSAGALIPRLRAVTETNPESSRFDSGAFALSESQAIPETRAAEPVSIVRPRAEQPRADQARTEKAPVVPGNQTADLLEALRRRRGERESASFDGMDLDGGNGAASIHDSRAAHPSTGSIRIVDVPIGSFPEEPEPPARTTSPQPRVGKKGRATMPSWDEIVFGARPDDDLA